MSDQTHDAHPDARADGMSAAQLEEDIDDLQSSLADLAALVTSPRGLPGLLEQVAT